MLKRIGGHGAMPAEMAYTEISDASFPSPFPQGLEYSCPARGTWNIVHTGFLIPQAHEIFVCAAGCLRGVVLTAAEMNASGRFSTIEVCENNLLDGDMEELIIDGVTGILESLHYKPRAVLLYTSCVHHFVGCDLKLCYDALRKRFPDIDFTDCYMNPIMRKSGLTPDQLMRRQLYSLIKERSKSDRRINIIGNNIPADKECELYSLAKQYGFELREIHDCTTYEEYQQLGGASANICCNPVGKAGGEALERRLGQRLLYLPAAFGYDEIQTNLDRLCSYMGAGASDWSQSIAACERELEETGRLLGGAPVALDYTAVLRPLGLARLLLDHGINVVSVYCDSFALEEKKDFDFLKESFPKLKLYPTVDVRMRCGPRRSGERVLAVGQKAAYFTGTSSFVNIVEGGGLYGFSGITKLCRLMRQAWAEEKDTARLIQIKGMGCGCV